MTLEPTVAWTGLLVLGAVHGINPAMGWLFAVSLGLQEQRRGAVWSALGPLALGHALSIAAVVALAGVIGLVVPVEVLKWIAAALLLGFGIKHLVRHAHPRWGGMRVGARDLTIWSFLMASAHGAGLMALPFVLEVSSRMPGTGHASHGPLSAGMAGEGVTGLISVVLHTAGYLAVTGAVAVVVYEKLGLRLLRRMWLNLDVIWAVALIATAILTPLI
ncbi:MAG: hypothetical protein ACOC8B_03130 [Gemmatimonadota bacterium]